MCEFVLSLLTGRADPLEKEAEDQGEEDESPQKINHCRNLRYRDLFMLVFHRPKDSADLKRIQL